MKRFTQNLVLVAVMAMGCETNEQVRQQDDVRGTDLNESIYVASINNAVIAQHTLYPYHFVPNAAALNELGERDLDVLAGHFGDSYGPLSIRQGETDPELYRDRVRTVTKRLYDAGLAAGRIIVSDALPGGDGMPNEQVLVILERRNAPVSKPYPSATDAPLGGSGRRSGGSGR